MVESSELMIKQMRRSHYQPSFADPITRVMLALLPWPSAKRLEIHVATGSTANSLFFGGALIPR